MLLSQRASHMAQLCSHPEPQNQGGRAGRDHRSSAGEADAGKGSTWEAQGAAHRLGGAEGWVRQVAGGALPLTLGVPRPSALRTTRARYNGVN